LAGFFFCIYFPNFQHLCKVICRLIICCLFLSQLWFCSAQNQVASSVWRIGFTQEVQKFNQFSNVRIQWEKNKNIFSFHLGLSAQKATQQLFAPSLSVDYAQLWKIKRIFLGPVMCLSGDTHVFGTRFLYLHSSVGYRFAIGDTWQFFQEATIGPTMESFTYFSQTYQQFTWNYHLKIGLQYALH
jgi:hypothetical protein